MTGHRCCMLHAFASFHEGCAAQEAQFALPCGNALQLQYYHLLMFVYSAITFSNFLVLSKS